MHFLFYEKFETVCSPFIMECLMEFYASYDDTSLRWNGADLLTRVGRKFLDEENGLKNQMELKLQPFFAFFPISRKNITRYEQLSLVFFSVLLLFCKSNVYCLLQLTICLCICMPHIVFIYIYHPFVFD